MVNYDFLYLKIAHNIETMIIQGEFVPGQKLPSIRQLIDKENASRTTIVRALNQLVCSGLVRVQDRSGYYVNDIGIYDPQRILNLKKLSKFDAMIANLFIAADENDLTFSTASLDTSLVPEVQWTCHGIVPCP